MEDDIFLSDYGVQRVSGSFKKVVGGVIKSLRGFWVGGHRGVGGWRKRKVKRIGRFLQ